MRASTALVLALCGFFGVDYAIFHTDAYSALLRFDSSTGAVETAIRNERSRPRLGDHQILTIGDSRMGFLPRVANKMNTGYEFASIAVFGATPRDWYYMLRGVDPDANRYSAIVIALEDYEDTESYEDHADRLEDLSYLIGRLQYSDIPQFARSFHSTAKQWAVARGVVLKGLIYKRDFQEFLLNPRERLDMASQAREDSYVWYYTYTGSNENVEGVVIDWRNRTIKVPPGFTEEQRAAFRSQFLDPPAPDKGRRSAYLHQWLGEIYRHYQRSKTRLIFIHLPRGPFVRPDQPAVNPQSSVRQMPHVVLMPEHLFDSIERPALFLDHMHMNGPGCEEFSRILAKEVTQTLNAL